MGDGLAADDALAYVDARRYFVHDFEEHLLDDRSETSRTSLQLERSFRSRLERITGKDKLDLVEREQLGVLLADRVAWLGEDAHQVVLAQRIDADDHWQTPDKLRDQAILEQVVAAELAQQVGVVLLG